MEKNIMKWIIETNTGDFLTLDEDQCMSCAYDVMATDIPYLATSYVTKKEAEHELANIQHTARQNCESEISNELGFEYHLHLDCEAVPAKFKVKKLTISCTVE